MPSPGRTRTFRFDLAAMISTHLRKPKQHPPPNPPPQGGRARKAESPSPLEGEGWGGGWTVGRVGFGLACLCSMVVACLILSSFVSWFIDMILRKHWLFSRIL